MELTLETRTEGPWTILHVEGELDLHTSPALREKLLELIDGGMFKVAIEMSSVGFMDSSTLGVLVACLKRLREKGGELALVGVTGSPRKVFTITGMDRVIPLFEQVADLPA